MIYIFYIIQGIFLIIFQTTVFPESSLFKDFYNVLTPYILYLGIFRPIREGAPIVVLLGFAMDGISGGPLGLYLTIFVWLYIGTRWLIQILHVGNVLLLAAVVAIGIAVECIIHFAIVVIQSPLNKIPPNAFKVTINQVLWAIFTGPLLLSFFHYTQGRYNQWIQNLFAEKNGLSRAPIIKRGP